MWWLEPVYTSGNGIGGARLVKTISHECVRLSAGVRASAVDFPSQEVGSFTGSRSNGSKENGFTREPVKSYSNRTVHVGINICTAEGDCFTSTNPNTPKAGRLSQSGKEWLLLSAINFKCATQQFSCVSTLTLRVWPISHLRHDSAGAGKPRRLVHICSHVWLRRKKKVLIQSSWCDSW